MRDGALGGTVGDLVVAGVVCILFGLAVAGALPVGATPVDRSADTPDSFFDSVAPVTGYDAIEVRITLDRDGTARWRVEFRYEVTEPATRQAFNRTRRNLTNPPGEFISLMRQAAVDPAEARTDRSMRILNGSVETTYSYPDGRFGIVRYRFTWTNFAARTTADRVVAGDALGGYELGPNESLIVDWGAGLRTDGVSPDPDVNRERTVRWDGPMRFSSSGPRVELAVTGSESNGVPVSTIVAAVGVLLAVGGVWYGRSRWYSSGDGTASDTASDRSGDSPAGSGQARADPTDELLSDEERVLRLLEDRDGRMRQQELIESVEWSRTKASDVVNEMHEAGQIEVFRLGRENVLALPGEIEI